MDKGKFSLRKYAMTCSVMLLALAMSWTGVVDRASTKYVDDALTQALSAYAVARSMNAVVSVLQSVSVGASVGASFQISPGEALDPINDMVERYSAVMELAIGSLLTQKILIKITSSQIFSLLLTLSVVAFLLSVVANARRLSIGLFRTALSLIFLRFAIVLAVLANGWVDSVFLHDDIKQNVVEMQSISDAAASRIPESPQAQDPSETEGLINSLKNGINGINEMAKAVMSQVSFSAVKELLDQSVATIMDLMTVFILKTLLLPLLFLYGLKHVFSRLWGWRSEALQPLAVR